MNVICRDRGYMKKVKTLIVEDEIFVARDLQLHLEQMGYPATSIVPSGEQAIQEIENEVPDLVLMDIELQAGMDGWNRDCGDNTFPIRYSCDIPYFS